ncbi:C40 family peptidase [Phytohabitans kaempferiae]|uniref:NlpC/P60 family protein n=1 Tax=Phytohabitans kaempferiae TaxID=1620943 RepID=A0ABV6M119_9ACTN
MVAEPAVGFVAAPVATLWSDPAAVRPVDAPALAPRADVGAWVSRMDEDQRVGDCVVSQLVLGERVLVEEVRADGWARVVAVEQPAARLDPRGYPGWLPAAQLAFGPFPAATPALSSPDVATPALSSSDVAMLVVDATGTALRNAPAGRVVLPGVVLGTRLPSAGPTEEGWRPLRVPGYDRPLWAPAAELVPLPAAVAPVDVLALARRLRDAVYVWGGMSGHGIDCSGLVHMAWRRFGVRLPRDASDQAAATAPLPPGTEQPGDLYFFARPGRPVHHVGFVSDRGPRHMLHACYRQRLVVEERLTDERAATLVAAHRVVAGQGLLPGNI